MVAKTCSTCRIEKALCDFHKSKARADGLYPICRSCCSEQKRAAYQINRVYQLEKMRKHRLKNIDAVREKDRVRGRLRTPEQTHASYVKRATRVKETSAQWGKRNPEKLSAMARAWRQRNKATVNFWDANRRANEKQATPSWANSFFIAEAYRLAKLREKVCGGKWHVDHTVPLQSKKVCGLHVEHNLQVIPATVNTRKSNVHWPQMP